MSTGDVIRLIAHTLSPETHGFADNQLIKLSDSNGFLMRLLQISTSAGVDFSIRHAAAIYLKNTIGRIRDRKGRRLENANDSFSFSDQDSKYIDQYLLSHIEIAEPVIRRQLLSCVRLILTNDIGSFGSVVENIIKNSLISDREQCVYAGLLILNEYIRKQSFRSATMLSASLVASNRTQLAHFYASISVTLLHFLKHFVTIATAATNHCQFSCFNFIHVIVKGFNRVISIELPLNIITAQIVSQYVYAFCYILKIECPEKVKENNAQTGSGQIKHPYWTTMKWTTRTLYFLIDKYGRPKFVRKIYVPFAKYFVEHFAEIIIESCMHILRQFDAGEFVSSNIIFQIMFILTKGISSAKFWSVLQPYIPFIIERIIFACMCISDEDESLIECDPIEFLNLKHHVDGDCESTAFAAKTLIRTIIRHGRSGLDAVIQFISAKANNNNNQMNYREKEGFLHLLGSISIDLQCKLPNDKEGLTDFFENNVIPDIRAQRACTRFRALWLLNEFGMSIRRDYNEFQIFASIIRILCTQFNCSRRFFQPL